jgi:hypothetical protein
LQSLGTGEEARAVAAIVEALDIAELLREDSFIVCQLIRARRAGEALDRLQTFLGQTSLSVEQSVTIDDHLAQMERRFRLAPTICAERAALFTTLDAVGSEEFAEAVETMFCTLSPNGSVPAVRNAAWKNRWWGSALYRPWLLHERAFALRMLSRYAGCVDQTGPAGQRAFDAVENDLVSQLDDVPINRAMFPAVRSVREAGLEHRQRLIAARLGLRVSRYRAELGRLPDSLDQVLDQQIDAVPAGLFSGKPLVYEAESERFAIYDVNPTSEEPAGRFEVSQARPPEPQ